MATEWATATLEDVCATITDGAHVSPREDPHGLPMASVKDLTRHGIELEGCKRISAADFATLKRQGCMPEWGDVLIAKDGNSALDTVCVHRLRDEVVLLSSVAILRPNSRIDSDFLRYYLDAPQTRALLKAGFRSGSAIPRVVLKDFRRAPVTLPPLNEQRAIGHILGTLDEKIRLNQRINETLEAMVRALFQSWFVAFNPVHAKAEGRDPGLPAPLASIFPDSFEDSELGRIPTGWQVGVLSDLLAELETGSRPRGGVSEFASGVPSIGAESIVGLGRFDYAKTKYVPEDFFDSMTKGRLKSRDVLLYKDGGRPGQFEPHLTLFGDGFPFETCAINEHVYRIRSKELLGQNFLFFWLSSNRVMEEMRTRGTGVAIPGLNSTQVRSLPVLVPGPEVTRAFDSFAEICVTSLLLRCNESRTLADLRNTLMPKLVSGQIRVSEAEQMLAALPR